MLYLSFVCFLTSLLLAVTAENLHNLRQTPIKTQNPRFKFYYRCQFQQAVNECSWAQNYKIQSITSLDFVYADGKSGKNTSDCSIGGNRLLPNHLSNWKCEGKATPIRVQTHIGGELRINCSSNDRSCDWKREKSVVAHDGGYMMYTNFTSCHLFIPNVSSIDIALWKCVVPTSHTHSKEDILSTFQLKNVNPVQVLRTLSINEDVPLFIPISPSPSTVINTIYNSTNVTYNVPYMWIGIGFAILLIHVILIACCCYFYGKSRKTRKNEYSDIQLRKYENQPDLNMVRSSSALNSLNNREMSNLENAVITERQMDYDTIYEMESEGYLKPIGYPQDHPSFKEKVLDRRSKIIQSHTYDYIV